MLSEHSEWFPEDRLQPRLAPARIARLYFSANSQIPYRFQEYLQSHLPADSRKTGVDVLISKNPSCKRFKHILFFMWHRKVVLANLCF
jgi:hypothetical protein